MKKIDHPHIAEKQRYKKHKGNKSLASGVTQDSSKELILNSVYLDILYISYRRLLVFSPLLRSFNI